MANVDELPELALHGRAEEATVSDSDAEEIIEPRSKRKYVKRLHQDKHPLVVDNSLALANDFNTRFQSTNY